MRSKSRTFLPVSPIFPLMVLLGIALLGADAEASCGDQVDGARVACACGDVVVSDTRLRPDDPVVTERCSTDGLLLRAPVGADSILLDLDAHAITGLGGGVGIRVLRGGADGAVIDGGSADRRGRVIGFATGVRATALRSVDEIRNLIVTGNTGDGIVVRGDDTKLVNVTADDNGRDGVRVGGRSPQLDGVEANGNRRFGVRASGAEVHGTATAVGNGRAALGASTRAAGQAAIEIEE